MPEDKFFTQESCDRCGNVLAIRTMSWFTRETICGECSDKEKVIRKSLADYGRGYEGCGYVPGVATT
jgi:hypothetical protein